MVKHSLFTASGSDCFSSYLCILFTFKLIFIFVDTELHDNCNWDFTISAFVSRTAKKNNFSLNKADLCFAKALYTL